MSPTYSDSNKQALMDTIRPFHCTVEKVGNLTSNIFLKPIDPIISCTFIIMGLKDMKLTEYDRSALTFNHTLNKV